MSFYSNDVVDGGIAKALVSTDDNEQAALYTSLCRAAHEGPATHSSGHRGKPVCSSKRLSVCYVMPDANINIDEITLK